jgi:hypothetical protein
MIMMCLALAVFAAALPAARLLAQTTGEVTPSGESSAEGEAAPSPQGLAGALGQVTATAEAMKGQLQQKRLAVLKELEAGTITAEQALQKLDDLPAPPSYYRATGGRSSWLKIEVYEDESDNVMITFPLSMLRWLIVEGPKMLPKEMSDELKEEIGVDLTAIDLSGLALALDALSSVDQMTLLQVQDGQQRVKIAVETIGGPSEGRR